METPKNSKANLVTIIKQADEQAVIYEDGKANMHVMKVSPLSLLLIVGCLGLSFVCFALWGFGISSLGFLVAAGLLGFGVATALDEVTNYGGVPPLGWLFESSASKQARYEASREMVLAEAALKSLDEELWSVLMRDCGSDQISLFQRVNPETVWKPRQGPIGLWDGVYGLSNIPWLAPAIKDGLEKPQVLITYTSGERVFKEIVLNHQQQMVLVDPLQGK